MAAPGVELIAGIERDPQFGPIVIVGVGGVLAEVLDDISLRLAPVSGDEARAMLSELHGAAILDGVRGRPAVDRSAVADILVALGRLAIDRPEILEIDLNPVVAGPDGAVAVDALVVMEGGR
jgi:acyl-CoA synthetase (NDP forming)